MRLNSSGSERKGSVSVEEPVPKQKKPIDDLVKEAYFHTQSVLEGMPKFRENGSTVVYGIHRPLNDAPTQYAITKEGNYIRIVGPMVDVVFKNGQTNNFAFSNHLETPLDELVSIVSALVPDYVALHRVLSAETRNRDYPGVAEHSMKARIAKWLHQGVDDPKDKYEQLYEKVVEIAREGRGVSTNNRENSPVVKRNVALGDKYYTIEHAVFEDHERVKVRGPKGNITLMHFPYEHDHDRFILTRGSAKNVDNLLQIVDQRSSCDLYMLASEIRSKRITTDENKTYDVQWTATPTTGSISISGEGVHLVLQRENILFRPFSAQWEGLKDAAQAFTLIKSLKEAELRQIGQARLSKVLNEYTLRS